MKFKEWSRDTNYSYLDPSDEYDYYDGALPKGTQVRFCDGDIGRVIESNYEKSLISHRPPSGSGCTEERQWYENEVLEIQD